MATSYLAVPGAVLPQRRTASLRDDLPIYLACLLGYVLLFPPQTNLIIGSSALPPYRFILIPAALLMLASSFKGRLRFGWTDLFIIITAFWVSIALFVNMEPEDAFTATVAQTTDIALAYFFGRVAFRSVRDLRIFLIIMAPGLAFVGLTMVIEAFSNQYVIQNIASALTGRPVIRESGARLGLFRAPGPFPHAILAGIFMASFLPLYLMSGIRSWPKYAGIFAAICSFFSVSSSALLALSVGLVLVSYDWVSQRITNISWRLFFAGAALVLFVAEFGTKGGAYSLIVRFAALNSDSAGSRVNIWIYGSQNVANNPWFGLGYNDWARPSWMGESVDHFWLLMAMRFGILPSVLIGLSTVIAVISLAKRSTEVHPSDRGALRAVAITLAVYALGIISVALWLSAHVWFFMLIGLATSLAAKPRWLPLQPRMPRMSAINAVEPDAAA